MLTVVEIDPVTRYVTLSRAMVERMERRARGAAGRSRFPEHAQALHGLASHFRMALRRRGRDRIEFKARESWFAFVVKNACDQADAFILGRQLGPGD